MAWGDIEIAHYREVFRDNPKFRAIATTARRVGLPYDVVRDTWSDTALHADEALAQLELEEHLERCPNCKAHPDEYLDDRGRERRAFGARWCIIRTDCRLCQLAESARAELTEHERKAGARIMIVPQDGTRPLVDTRIR